MPCTVIRNGDLADQILDRSKHPEWQGERTRLVYEFPTNEKLWAQYAQLRGDSLRNDGNGKEATAFYRAHRAEMDAGAIYLGTGLTVAISAGWIIGRLRMEKYVEEWVYKTQVGSSAPPDQALTWPDRIGQGWTAVKDIVGRVWLYVMIGIAVGAGIHGYVPEQFMVSIMGKAAWWSVPLAVLLGVPMYSNAAGIIPVVEALLGKGAALGTVLAFMMSVIALSLPEAVILRKVLKMRLIFTFFGIVAMGIMLIGYLFNCIM
jgi:uncharacterized membrane protein YraQ (UPF0718 family)